MTTSARFLVRSSAVPEPVEGKTRCFYKLSNRKVQGSKLMVLSSRFRVQGSKFKVQGSYYNTHSIVSKLLASLPLRRWR